MGTLSLFTDCDTGAVISACGYYRYQLWRIWDNNKPLVLFVMMNPSKADAEENDPTINRCISFARSWGYGGIYVGNLFAYRSTSPDILKTVKDPVGPYNKNHLWSMAMKCEIIICAWGNNQGKILDRVSSLPKDKLHFLDLSFDGTPKHPLYLKGSLKPISINQIPN